VCVCVQWRRAWWWLVVMGCRDGQGCLAVTFYYETKERKLSTSNTPQLKLRPPPHTQTHVRSTPAGVHLRLRMQELAEALDKAGIEVDEAGLLMIVEKSEEDLVKAGFKMVHARKLKQIVSKYRIVEQIPEQPGMNPHPLSPPPTPSTSRNVCVWSG
jgi:hypothetical protein